MTANLSNLSCYITIYKACHEHFCLAWNSCLGLLSPVDVELPLIYKFTLLHAVIIMTYVPPNCWCRTKSINISNFFLALIKLSLICPYDSTHAEHPHWPYASKTHRIHNMAVHKFSSRQFIHYSSLHEIQLMSDPDRSNICERIQDSVFTMPSNAAYIGSSLWFAPKFTLRCWLYFIMHS